MYKTLIILSLAGLTFSSCKPTPRTAGHPQKSEQSLPNMAERPAQQEPAAGPASETPMNPPEQQTKPAPQEDPEASLLAVDVTMQDFNLLRPWEKQQASNAQICGVYLGDGRVLTYGKPLKAATYVEISLPDGSRTAPAQVLRYNEDLQLGLLSVLHETDAGIFETRKAYPVGKPLERGDAAELWCMLRGTEPLQVPLQAESGAEDEGLPRLSMRADQAVPNGFFFGAPVMKNGCLAGLSAGYSQQTRNLLVINAELIQRFLAESESEPSPGVPVLGVSQTPLNDPVFRKYLKLGDEQTGVYISTVQPGSAAEEAGVKAGDVLTAIEGMPIDNQGRCQLPLYGHVNLAVVTHYLKPIGGKILLSVSRNGENMELEAPLNRDAVDKALMGREKPGVPPRYVMWGGLLFQPLTATYLNTLKEQAKNTLPVEFLELENRKEELLKRGYKELTALTLVVPTPATLGYDGLGFCLVEKVNGKEARSFSDFVNLLDEATADGLVELTLNKPPYAIYLDRATVEACNGALRRSSIPRLRQLGETESKK